MRKKLVFAGYALALVCFIGSLCARFDGVKDWAGMLTALGGILLTVTSLYKIFSEAGKR